VKARFEVFRDRGAVTPLGSTVVFPERWHWALFDRRGGLVAKSRAYRTGSTARRAFADVLNCWIPEANAGGR
jgi:hypothetical protein